mgnify:CR=1 FL=1
MKMDWTSVAIGAALGYFLLPGVMGQKLVKKECTCVDKDKKPCK